MLVIVTGRNFEALEDVFSSTVKSFKEHGVTILVPKNIGILEKIRNKEKSLIALEEPYSWVDVRLSGTKTNRLLSYYFMDRRKIENAHTLISVFNLDYVDKRIRQLVDIRMQVTLASSGKVMYRGVDINTGRSGRGKVGEGDIKDFLDGLEKPREEGEVWEEEIED